ncbi:hypothetical protein CGGC5_v013519 [Colletotrichum fructicola Nara gc5]|uniref:Uncharacterized protein n=1 Tax=Colletotrichum fructicola (strain Nara gc5) TaxID=1213859 RepID=A0A7J6IKW2_COLFN|nr:hypothetical protein CGGC5_v013519 [Colletotrichum fructicola Nara gc5]
MTAGSSGVHGGAHLCTGGASSAQGAEVAALCTEASAEKSQQSAIDSLVAASIAGGPHTNTLVSAVFGTGATSSSSCFVTYPLRYGDPATGLLTVYTALKRPGNSLSNSSNSFFRSTSWSELTPKTSVMAVLSCGLRRMPCASW